MLLHLLAIMNNVSVNTGMQIPVQVPAFHPPGCISGSEIAGSYGNSVFDFWGTPHSFLALPFLFPPVMNEGLRFPISYQCLLFFVFVIMAVLMVWSVQMCFLFLFGVFPLKEVRVNGWSGESWLGSFLMRAKSYENPVFIYFIYQLLYSHNIIVVWNHVIFVSGLCHSA